MPTIQNNRVTYQGGEALPQVGSPEYVAAQNGQIKPFTPVSTTSSAIGAGLIGTTTPYTVPPIATTPTTGNLSIANNSAAATIASDAAYTPPANSDKDAVNAGIKDVIASIKGQPAAIDAINSDAGLAEKKKRAESISSELDFMDKAYRDEIKQIKETSGGTLAGQQDKLRLAEDRYQNNRANAALSYKLASGDYQGAQDIVNAKVSALKDSNAQSLQAYQLLANSINDDLTESEKIQVTSQTNAKEKKAASLENAYSTTLSAAVKNGAPNSVLSAIDAASKAPNATEATIMAAAGRYAGDIQGRLLKDAQIRNLNSEIAKKDAEAKKIAFEAGGASSYGLEADDPIFYAVQGITSEIGKKSAIQKYTNLKNAGNVEGANKFLDTVAYQSLTATQKEDYGVYSDGQRIIGNVLGDMETFKASNIGVWNTALQKALPLANLQKDQKWVNVTSQVEQAQARIRRGFFGTALTGTEKGSADLFLIDFGRDDIATAQTKLKNMEQLATDIKARLLRESKGEFDAPQTSSDPLEIGVGTGIDPNNNPLGI